MASQIVLNLLAVVSLDLMVLDEEEVATQMICCNRHDLVVQIELDVGENFSSSAAVEESGVSRLVSLLHR